MHDMTRVDLFGKGQLVLNFLGTCHLRIRFPHFDYCSGIFIQSKIQISNLPHCAWIRYWWYDPLRFVLQRSICTKFLGRHTTSGFTFHFLTRFQTISELILMSDLPHCAWIWYCAWYDQLRIVWKGQLVINSSGGMPLTNSLSAFLTDFKQFQK